MIVVRHGLMLVGPTGGGKSSNLHILENTLGNLKKQGIVGFGFENVKIMQLNPKSITMGQMYGTLHIPTLSSYYPLPCPHRLGLGLGLGLGLHHPFYYLFTSLNTSLLLFLVPLFCCNSYLSPSPSFILPFPLPLSLPLR